MVTWGVADIRGMLLFWNDLHKLLTYSRSDGMDDRDSNRYVTLLTEEVTYCK